VELHPVGVIVVELLFIVPAGHGRFTKGTVTFPLTLLQ
jgi:hypothetical protein